ncbi:gamma carbonic anhydrase family protein [Paracoccaceae bacterium]|nr:gamma carbonic anhydrase family protein [Paracoccaceae bacterium]
MTLFSLNSIKPNVPDSDSFWLAPDSNVIGNVEIQDLVSIWFGSTVRGDNDHISIGPGSNIQENCVLHTDKGFPLTVGMECTIGHKAILHGCSVGDGSLIGMGAIILNGAIIGKNCLIGAGTLVPENKVIPDGSLYVGSPCRFVRKLSETEKNDLILTAINYQENMKRYKHNLKKLM